jgi:hypothetical protein
MLWLIWIAIMLVVPVVAGLDVWFRLNREAHEAQASGARPDDGLSA